MQWQPKQAAIDIGAERHFNGDIVSATLVPACSPFRVSDTNGG